jgi:hypothetical protein
VATSWEQYQGLAAGLVEPLPDGLILHAAGPTDEGVRIIDVWASEDAWERYRSERLDRALAALDGLGSPRATFRHLHPEHVVLRHRDPAPNRVGKEER